MLDPEVGIIVEASRRTPDGLWYFIYAVQWLPDERTLSVVPLSESARQEVARG